MFKYEICLILFGISLPGIYSLKPLIKDTYLNLAKRIPAEKKLPSESNFILISFVQTLVITLLAIMIGVTVYHKTGLAPFLNSSALTALIPAIINTLLISFLGAAVFLMIYYLVFRRWVEHESIQHMEKLRVYLGLSSRLLYGGLVEEILSRWGLMNLFVWVGLTVTRQPASVVYWASILLSGLFFALGHLPAYYATGCKKSLPFFSMIITLNLWASIIFGYLFWQYGLLAAMFGHTFFHLLWYPFDCVSSSKSMHHST